MSSPERSSPIGYPGSKDDQSWRRFVYPSGYENPKPNQRYHIIVIGAGPAGLVIAIAAAGLGARVALVERTAMGGDCLNVGCVPSKALLEFTSHHGHTDCFDEAFAWLRHVRSRIAEHDSVDRYAQAGVDVFLGSAKFVNDDTILVEDTELTARRIVIATGARAVLPPIPGLAETRPLTNESLFDLRKRPNRLAVIGAGPIGCEIAQAFSRMNIEVDVLDMANRVLSTEHPEASRIVAEALQQSGVQLHLAATISRVERRGSNVVVATDSSEVHADELLVAAGRRANTDELNLAAVGVATDESGQIIVDDYLRSTNPRIYAAGDVCSNLQFTHNADAHARIVVQNALFFASTTTRKLIIPHCTYTQPEVAQVGQTRTSLEPQGIDFDIHRVAFDELDRGKTQGDAQGFAELLTSRNGKQILGATIVGPDAGEQIASVCIAMTNGLGLSAFDRTILPYPTRAEFLRNIAGKFKRKQLTPTAKRLFSSWFKWIIRA